MISTRASRGPAPATTTPRSTAAPAAPTAPPSNRNTSNGCHGGRTDSADLPFQHVAPPTTMTYYGSSGGGSPVTARLSRFLNDPGHDDELARRERQLAAK